jgi:hypothetical protein
LPPPPRKPLAEFAGRGFFGDNFIALAHEKEKKAKTSAAGSVQARPPAKVKYDRKKEIVHERV